jgi:phosphoenolpyruvate-protein phosphotransferase
VVAPIWRWTETVIAGASTDLIGPAAPGRLMAALEEVRRALAAKSDRLRARGATAEAGILDAQALMLDDPALLDGALALIAKGRPADDAVEQALEPFAVMLRASPDPVFQARAADVHDVVAQVRRALRGSTEVPPPAQPSILVARDLAPSQTAGLDRDLVVGFATEQGSATAHTAILARALGLPAVVGVAGLVDQVEDGQVALLDGDQGTLLLDPPAALAAQVAPPRSGPASDPAPAETVDGRRIEVGCNAAGPDDARRAAAAGADGIGLLRSEFLFLGRDQLPDEDEQVTMLTEVLDALGGRPVILRTLDVGADKPLPALPQPPEANPALGVRGLRLQLQRHPDLLKTQLRAALRVAPGHALRIMFPMVSTVGEVRAARRLLLEAQRELFPGKTPPPLEVGIMVEVPAAAVAADVLAAEADFFSLGTNDLAQYLFAADRTNPDVAPLADSLHPAMLRVIGDVAAAAHRHRRWVGICGEMASDPWALPLLIGLGLDELSVHPPAVAGTKARLRRLSAAECTQAAQATLGLEDGEAVRRLLITRGLAPSPRTG